MAYTLMINGDVATGLQIQDAINIVYDPCMFIIKANNDSYSRQAVESGVVKDVAFTNVDATYCGDFSYVGGVVKYIGTETALFSLDMTCSIASSVVNTIVKIGQYKNDVVDYGVMCGGKIESSTAILPFSLNSTFELAPNDEVNLKIESDKTANLDIYFFQALIKMIKIL